MDRRYWLVLILLIILSPLGLLADGTAWGEWEAEKLQNTLGYIPQGMERLGDFWQAAFPDYSMKFLGESTISQSIGYVFSAIVGSGITYAIVMIITRILIRHKKQIGPF